MSDTITTDEITAANPLAITPDNADERAAADAAYRAAVDAATEADERLAELEARVDAGDSTVTTAAITKARTAAEIAGRLRAAAAVSMRRAERAKPLPLGPAYTLAKALEAIGLPVYVGHKKVGIIEDADMPCLTLIPQAQGIHSTVTGHSERGTVNRPLPDGTPRLREVSGADEVTLTYVHGPWHRELQADEITQALSGRPVGIYGRPHIDGSSGRWIIKAHTYEPVPVIANATGEHSWALKDLGAIAYNTGLTCTVKGEVVGRDVAADGTVSLKVKATVINQGRAAGKLEDAVRAAFDKEVGHLWPALGVVKGWGAFKSDARDHTYSDARWNSSGQRIEGYTEQVVSAVFTLVSRMR